MICRRWSTTTSGVADAQSRCDVGSGIPALDGSYSGAGYSLKNNHDRVIAAPALSIDDLLDDAAEVCGVEQLSNGGRGGTVFPGDCCGSRSCTHIARIALIEGGGVVCVMSRDGDVDIVIATLGFVDDEFDVSCGDGCPLWYVDHVKTNADDLTIIAVLHELQIGATHVKRP